MARFRPNWNRKPFRRTPAGMIRVTVNGKQQVVSMKIEKEVVNPEEVEMLEDLIVSAVNKGIEESSHGRRCRR